MPLVSSLLGSHQISAASNSEQGALNHAITSTNDMLGNSVSALYSGISGANNLLQPYADAGTAGVNGLMSALQPGGSLTQQFAFDPTQIANNPDYKFAVDQGDQAVQRAAAATGTLMSGGTLKALSQYNAGANSQYLNQYFNQALNTFNTNRTASLQNYTLPISIGQSATTQAANNIFGGNSQIASTTMGASNQLNSLLEGKGAASAAGSVAQGNVWGSFLNNLGAQVTPTLMSYAMGV